MNKYKVICSNTTYIDAEIESFLHSLGEKRNFAKVSPPTVTVNSGGTIYITVMISYTV
jgi:hypothetical protein